MGCGRGKKGVISVEASAASKAAHLYRYVPALARSPPDTQGATSPLPGDELPDSCVEAKRYPRLSAGRWARSSTSKTLFGRTRSRPAPKIYVLVHLVQEPRVVESASTCASARNAVKTPAHVVDRDQVRARVADSATAAADRRRLPSSTQGSTSKMPDAPSRSRRGAPQNRGVASRPPQAGRPPCNRGNPAEANTRLKALLSVLERFGPYHRILVVQRALGWRPDEFDSSATPARYR